MINVKSAIRKAEEKYSAAEQLRRREDLIAEVNRLARVGVTHDTIAGLMDINVRQVVRMCNGQVTDPNPPARFKFPTDPGRVKHMESLADAALELACLQRDEDPQLVWEALLELDRWALQELTAVALAAIPVDLPKSELFAWLEVSA